VTRLSAWTDPAVAREYEVRRFGSLLGRIKHARDEELVLELLGDDPRCILDLASGTGRFLPALARGGRRVVACDLSAAMLRVGVHAGRGEVLGRVQASAFALPFADDAFDAALSMRFFFHVEGPAERVRILTELARVTRGVVLGEVRYRWTGKQAGRYLRSRVGLARRWRSANDWRALAGELRAAGLELVRLVPKSRLFSDKALFLARRA